MCGINGVYWYKHNPDTSSNMRGLRDVLEKRGPDAVGDYEDELVYLGHRRLSVIDLNTGNQPMQSADGNVIVAYNGEIYNFQLLREQLLKQGASFKTKSDTEVIIVAYQVWGIEKCLQSLEGMFAFALWDKSASSLYLARDRYGEKPLYYTSTSNGFIFASELKAIEGCYDKINISKTALNLYLSLTYIPAPWTIYKDVYKLEAGHYLCVNTTGISKKGYYNLKEIAESNQARVYSSYEEAQNELRERLFESVRQRMVSDVPLGAFLSGGIDSSIISAIMAQVSSRPIKTYSIGFEEKDYDESDRSDLVAKHIGSEHTLHVLNQNDLLAVVDETISYLDEPFGDSSIIPSMMVARKAREQVTVVLTGDCADELFGGYEKYLGKYYVEKYLQMPKIFRKGFEGMISLVPHNRFTNHTLRKVKKVVNSAELSKTERYLQLASLGFSTHDKTGLLNSDFQQHVDQIITAYFDELSSDDELVQTFYSDVKLVLEGDMLAKVDRACMMNSLEARVPFLDSGMVDFSFRLPTEFKINGNNKKRILKDTFRDLLPEEVFSFSKKGFGLPLRIWFKKELKNELENLLDPGFIEEQGIFQSRYFGKVLSEHMSGKENHSVKLWLLFVFQKWYKQHVA